MPDSIAITVTKEDGTVVAITGAITGATVVEAPPPPQPPSIPAGALVIDLLSGFTGWQMNHDAGTPGDQTSSTGKTSYPVTAPDGTPNCRLFDFTNSKGGGFIYHGKILIDASKYTNFCYRLEEYSADWSNVTNSETDLERADAAGHPLDMATQLDGFNGVIDVTINGKWQGTGVKADPSKRDPKVWHSEDVYVTDNGDGTATYHGVTLDGVYNKIDVTGPNKNMSAIWGPNGLNVQREFVSRSQSPVHCQVYARKFQIICW